MALGLAQLPGFEGEMPSFQEALQYVSSIVDDVSIDLSDTNFEAVTHASSPNGEDWFIYFFSPECMKCRFISPQWRFLAERVKDEGLSTHIGKVNADINEKLLIRFRVFSYPTFLYFKDGFYYNYTEQPSPEGLYEVVSGQGFTRFERKEVPEEITWAKDWYMFIRWWVMRLRGYLLGGGAALAIYKVAGWVKGRLQARPKSE